MEITTKYNYKDKVIHQEDRKTHTIWNTEIKSKINWVGQVEFSVWYTLDLSRRWWKESELFPEGE